MTEGYWVIRKYTAGPIGEAVKFWKSGKKPDRLTRKVKREINVAMKNKQSAIKEANRKANENFMEGDGLVTVDYSDEALKKLNPVPAEEQTMEDAIFFAARANAMKWIKRVQAAMKKQGVPFRYMLWTSDRDGDTGEAVRVHHHLLVNREARDYLFAKWRDGGIDWRNLSAQPDYLPIVNYMMQQVRHIPDLKKYTPSRNLKTSEPKDRVSNSPAEIRPPKGAVLLDRSSFKPGAPQYIRYILPDQYEEADTDVQENGVVVVHTAKGHRRPRNYETMEEDGSHGV